MDFKALFQDELAYIRLLADEMAETHPELADYLSRHAADPDVQQLFEHFAFLTAKLRHKVEDELPEVTQNLLERVWSAPLRPLPGTAILQFIPQKLSSSFWIEKGTEVKSVQSINRQGSMRKKVYTFQTCRSVNVLPLSITQVETQQQIDRTILTLTFSWQGSKEQQSLIHELDGKPIAIYLGNDSVIARKLRLAFSQYIQHIYLSHDQGITTLPPESFERKNPVCAEDCVQPIGLTPYWRLQLIQDYFSLPHVNDFIYFTPETNFYYHCIMHSQAKLSIELAGTWPELASLSGEHFQLNCVPIINLFTQDQTVIKKARLTYGLVSEHLDETDIYQIKDIVLAEKKETETSSQSTEQTQRGQITHFLPITEFYQTHFSAEHAPYFYAVLLEKDIKAEMMHHLYFFDKKGEKVEIDQPLACEVLCMNRETEHIEPQHITGKSHPISAGISLSNLTKISVMRPPMIEGERLWSLISDLSLSPHFLQDKLAIQSLLKEFNLYATSGEKQQHDKQIDGIRQVSARPLDWLTRGTLQRGVELTLCLDRRYFQDLGELFCFGEMVSQVLSYCLYQENFLKVIVVVEHHQDGQVTDNLQTTTSLQKTVWSLPPQWGDRSSI